MEERRSTEAKFIFSRMIIVLFIMLFLFAFFVNRNYKKEYRLVFIPKVMDEENGFWTSLIAGSEMGAEENGLNLIVKGPSSEDDVDTQIKLLKDVIKEKPDAVLISPNDYTALDDILEQVKSSGISIILVDSVVKSDIANGIVATDNIEAGKFLGSYAKKLVKKESRIAIVGHVKDSSTAIEREKGIREGLGDEADRICQTQYSNSSFNRAYELTREMIQNNPEIDILIGTNEYSAVGAARAIKDMELSDKIHVLGFDSSLEETQLLEEGIFDCIVIQRPFNMGYLSVEQAVKKLEGKHIEQYIDPGCKLITRENMYEDENQKLLYPFVERK